MSGYNVKNYTEQGGEVTHIGGKLVFDEGAIVEGFPGGGGDGSTYVLPVASETRLGGVKVGSGLSIDDGVLSSEQYTLPEASADAIGGVMLVENQSNSTATTVDALKEDFNTLLAALKAAGVMAAD